MSVETQRHLECDLLVAGGGLAGVCCAIAAARQGVRVILCQDRSVLGGNASSEVRMHVVGATGLRGGAPIESELREGGLIEEIRLDLSVLDPQRSPSMMDLVLYDKCVREPNITLLLNAALVAAKVESGLIRSVSVLRHSTEERFDIKARVFVDCTGDGRLGVEAGAAFRHGRESRDEYGESLAQPQADSRTLGSTILFQARRHDRPMPFTAPPWVRRFRPGDFKLRPFAQPGLDLGLEYGYWWAEWGGCLDTIKDNERIRDELLAITLGIWNYVKNESGADASHWALEWFGFLPGKRESRRFIGQHVLREADVFGSQPYPDAIAYGGWPVDTHPPEGVDAPELPPCEQHHLPHLYDVPLRACIARSPANLMWAGRNISATHIAFASTRVMATCAAIGQGVGTAAAIALRENVQPAELTVSPDLVKRIQQQLLKDDCYLIGVRNEDPLDLVRAAASITASSSLENADPRQVRSGQTRSVHGSSARELTCAPAARAFPGTHRWMSDPAQGFPCWLQIEWDEPVILREIILIFDTGQHRHLTLSQADGYVAMMQWGRPQEETVKDYTLAVRAKGEWREIVTVANNYQRRSCHRLDGSTSADALRVVVRSTNGIDHARIFEVRAYA